MANYIGADRGFQYLFDAVDDVKNDIAEQYDSTATYAVGDYVLYDNILYKCITAVSTAESFDNTKWTQVVLTDQIAAGVVSDVQIDNVSVVSGGIANIPSMTGATTAVAGAKGLVPAPLAGDEDKYLKGDGTWAAVQTGAGALSGLSDVDLSSPTDGQALVYDGANSKWINGNVSGGGDISAYGVFIDTSNIIVPSTAYTTTMSYLATEDCAVYIDFYGSSNGSAYVYIDGEQLSRIYTTTGGAIASELFLLKKGQTISADSKQSNAISYRVYGLQGGSNPTPQTALIYSTEEREVGVWTDGKPLYQKTLIVNNPTNNTDLEYDLGVTDLDEVISQEGTWDRDMGSGGIWTYDLNATNERAFTNSYIVIARIRNGTKKLYVYVGTTYPDVPCIRFTFRYTKTTDTAGSGTWTTTGEYAHHYSTSEKVIGTWIDGKPLYEKTYDLGIGATIDIDISDLNISTCVSVSGGTVDGQSLPLILHRSSVEAYNIALYARSNKLSIRWGSSTTPVRAYATIRYTKTTDV